jgi:hypothetical protein
MPNIPTYVDNETYVKFLNLSDADKAAIREMIKEEVNQRSKTKGDAEC